LTSKAAWSDAASYTMADIKMLRKELVIGYAAAGFLAVVVPTTVWNDVFFQGHGIWTTLENVLVGPFIAVISFVCSIGNVPMAAALWHGGISFGGVISFIFADLIAFPLLLIYRKYYGTRLTLRIFFTFWAVMAAAGLIVEVIFDGFDLIPKTRPQDIVHTGFEWNYTSVLNIVFLGVFAVLYWLYRNRERLGGGRGYALDPVCGMQVRTADAPATRRHNGHSFSFCSDRCVERFEAEPDRFAAQAATKPSH
jgi:YHS domain-containing protein